MKSDQNRFERGAEWRQWDLHIHTPASFHWDGQGYVGEAWAPENAALTDHMIRALNDAKPAVFALMDYWTFDGWFALKRRREIGGAPILTKTVFPGIELRLAAPTSIRLNAHVIFSDEINDQVLKDFLASLIIEVVNRPLSNAALIDLARQVSVGKLKHHGFDKGTVDKNDAMALKAGSTIAEINCDSYKKAIESVPDGMAVGFMPYDTSDGLEKIGWKEHYAYFLGLFSSSPIFESRNIELRNAFVNEQTEKNKGWLKDFQSGLKNIPRLVVAGSDAHRMKGVKGDQNKRGYGDFPSDKATWIKADPTFRGLLQAIKEPAKRSFIGSIPNKLLEVESNKTYFIDRLEINRMPGALTGKWVSETNLPLNHDLVAIIGNKGSGKSALADIIALLGHSKQKLHFTFLKKDRFRGKSGDPAKYFTAKLYWLDGSFKEENLNDDPAIDKVEMVRYIPQGHFENLCNEHISGRSNAFERELREVIFQHLDDSIRLGALDFDQLIDRQESGFRDQLNELRKELHKINEDISSVEDQLQPEVRNSLMELLTLKNKQVEELKKVPPEKVEDLSKDPTDEDKQAADRLEQISKSLVSLQEGDQGAALKTAEISGKIKSAQNIRDRMKLLERAYKTFLNESEEDFKRVDLKAVDVATLTFNLSAIDDLFIVHKNSLKEIATAVESSRVDRDLLLNERAELSAKLDAPQLAYQKYLADLEVWNNKLAILIGSDDAPESKMGLERRLAQINELPTQRLEFYKRRLALAGEIFDVLNEQREAREKLFKPVQDLIQSNGLIREDYKLQFQATFGTSPDQIATLLFTLIKQNSGEFRGEDESFNTVRKLADEYNFSKRDDVIAFVESLHARAQEAASGKSGIGIKSILRKDRVAVEVFDLLFGLTFLDLKYSLLFQDTQIEQLSPGQRGALLLIFYLLVDKGRNPILLDQPEENLDNETVVGLLVPVLTEAKKRRQILMVTHNPNLAVVCDAEQVIHATFDRKNEFSITYCGGAIENSRINSRVVDVLEGTKPAFDNRGSKYY